MGYHGNHVQYGDQNGNQLSRDVYPNATSQYPTISMQLLGDAAGGSTHPSHINNDQYPLGGSTCQVTVYANDSAVDESNARQCKYCHKMFCAPAMLKRHLLVHTGERSYVCEFCPKKFGLKSSLKRHVVSVHKQPFYEPKDLSS